MEITVFKERDNSIENIEFSGKILLELLQSLNINSETVIIVRKGEVITEQEVLNDKDHLEILSVISGG